MNSAETTIQNNDWQAALQWLGHDIDAYRALTAVWPEKEVAADDLLAILNHRRVIRHGLAVLRHWDCLDAQKQEINRLETIWGEAENQLTDVAVRAQARIADIINQDWVPMLETLETQIRQVRRAVRDNYLFENRSEHELRLTAVTCLDAFQKMAFAAHELRRAPFEGLPNARGFINQFEAVGTLLKGNFGYFYLAKDYLADLRKRMHGLEAWWLTYSADPDAVEDEIPDEWVEDLFYAYRADQADGTEDCKQSPLAIAYAMNELDADDRVKMDAHLLSCRACFELVSDVRAAEQKARKMGDKPPKISREIADAIQSVDTENGVEPFRFSQVIRNALQRLSNLLTPKFVSVMATACILIVVALYGSSLMLSPKKSEKRFAMKTIAATIDVTAISGPLSTRGDNDAPRAFKLEPGATLQTGDHFSIEIEVNQDAYCYLLLDDQGTNQIHKLFEGEIRANHPKVVTQGAEGVRLGPYRGAKTVYLLASDGKIENFDHKMREVQRRGAESIQTLLPNAAVQTFRFGHQ